MSARFRIAQWVEFMAGDERIEIRLDENYAYAPEFLAELQGIIDAHRGQVASQVLVDSIRDCVAGRVRDAVKAHDPRVTTNEWQTKHAPS